MSKGSGNSVGVGLHMRVQ